MKLDCAEIIRFRGEHDKENKLEIIQEKEIGDKLRTTKTLTKEDLVEIINWKFDCDGRVRANELRLVKDIDEQLLEEVSHKVFSLDNNQDVERIRLLQGFKGIGIAVASVILTFFDPEYYGVFDFHVYQELFGRRPRYTIHEYAELLSRLRAEARKCGLSTRDVEKAYFRKNCLER